jgi:hypothetical protein
MKLLGWRGNLTDSTFLGLVDPGMNFDVSAALRAALTSKFITQISNTTFLKALELQAALP